MPVFTKNIKYVFYKHYIRFIWPVSDVKALATCLHKGSKYPDTLALRIINECLYYSELFLEGNYFSNLQYLQSCVN